MDFSTFSQDRARYLFYTAALLIAALTLVAIFNIAYPQPPAGAWQPAPDPTPIIVDRGWEINIGSKNCLGWTVSCNNQ